MLVDCGKASEVTQGQFNELFTEIGTPPFNKWHGCCIGDKGDQPLDPLDLEPLQARVSDEVID
jgi:hypothetical protein